MSSLSLFWPVLLHWWKRFAAWRLQFSVPDRESSCPPKSKYRPNTKVRFRQTSYARGPLGWQFHRRAKTGNYHKWSKFKNTPYVDIPARAAEALLGKLMVARKEQDFGVGRRWFHLALPDLYFFFVGNRYWNFDALVLLVHVHELGIAEFGMTDLRLFVFSGSALGWLASHGC